MTIEEKYKIVRAALVGLVGSDDVDELKTMKGFMFAAGETKGLSVQDVYSTVKAVEALLETHD